MFALKCHKTLQCLLLLQQTNTATFLGENLFCKEFILIFFEDCPWDSWLEGISIVKLLPYFTCKCRSKPKVCLHSLFLEQTVKVPGTVLATCLAALEIPTKLPPTSPTLVSVSYQDFGSERTSVISHTSRYTHTPPPPLPLVLHMFVRLKPYLLGGQSTFC